MRRGKPSLDLETQIQEQLGEYDKFLDLAAQFDQAIQRWDYASANKLFESLKQQQEQLENFPSNDYSLAHIVDLWSRHQEYFTELIKRIEAAWHN